MSLRQSAIVCLLCACTVACSDDDDPPAGASGDHQACVDRINAFRATIGLPAYARDASSEACADAQAQSDAQTDDPHGAFGDCGEFAQNECPGWDSIAETIDGC